MTVTKAIGKKKKKERKINLWLDSGWNNHLRLKKAAISSKCAAVEFVLDFKLEKKIILSKSSQIKSTINLIANLYMAWCPI